MPNFIRDYKRLLGFVVPHLGVLGLAVICMVATSAFSGVSIGMVIPLVDNIIAGKKIVLPPGVPAPLFVSDFILYVNSMSPTDLLNRMIIVIMVLWFFKNFFEFCQTYFMNDLSQRVIRDVKGVIYKKLLTLSLDYYAKHSTGKLMSRITNDAAIIRDSISTGLTDIFYQPIQLLIYVVLLAGVMFFFSISWMIMFFAAVLLPLVIYPVIKIGKRLKSISRQSQEKSADITTTLHETISGIRVVKAFSMEGYESRKFNLQNQHFYKLAMKSVKRMTVVSPITEFVGMACIAGILWVAGKEIVFGKLSAGAFITFLALFLSLMRPVKRLTNVYTINQQAMAAADRIFEVLDTRPSITEKPNARELKSVDTITFKDVRFGYEDTEILKGVSFELKKGEIVAFVGPSGAGKTTLVNLIPRFYDVTGGSVLINGIDVRDYSLKSLRGKIGLVTQETILFNDTVSANISYGASAMHLDDVVKAAHIANAHTFIMNLPQGYSTSVGERGFRLSGGEKQRLSIARAVYKDPPLLILDEATSQLDTHSESLVQEAIDRMMQGRTACVIAHRLSTIKHADRIYVLKEGRIAECGAHDELIARNGLYKHLYDMQFRDDAPPAK